MNKIKAILVDDEQSARNVLSSLLATNCPEVELICTCTDVKEAVEAIVKYQPDLVFLDVQMPDYNGYELVNFIPDINFEIIFVTAFDQYALKAFEISATDYLLKPVKRARLKDAVQKVAYKIESNQNFEDYKVLANALQQRKVTQLAVSSTEGKTFFKLKEIIAIGGEGAYSVIYFQDGKTVTTSKNLKHFEEVLSNEKQFFRCHKSWIVNLDFISKMNSTQLIIELDNCLEIKFSKSKRLELASKISNK